MALSFIPAVKCAKCGRMVQTVSRFSVGDKRYLRVACHGKTIDIPFVSAPGEVVTVFHDKVPELPA